jgi:prevent-host-death family protein
MIKVETETAWTPQRELLMRISDTANSLTVGDLASQAQQIIEEVRDTSQPVWITIDGKRAAVLLGAAHYDALQHLLNLSRMLHEAEGDLRAGRVQVLEEFLDELDREQKAAGRNNRKRKA